MISNPKTDTTILRLLCYAISDVGDGVYVDRVGVFVQAMKALSELGLIEHQWSQSELIRAFSNAEIELASFSKADIYKRWFWKEIDIPKVAKNLYLIKAVGDFAKIDPDASFAELAFIATSAQYCGEGEHEPYDFEVISR